MAWQDERPGEQLRLPLQPAIAPSARDQRRHDLPASVQCRERGVSREACLPRPQDLESAGSKMVATCAVVALPLPLDFPPRRPQRNSEDVVIPFPAPMLRKHRCQLNKVCSNPATNTCPHDLTRCLQIGGNEDEHKDEIRK